MKPKSCECSFPLELQNAQAFWPRQPTFGKSNKGEVTQFDLIGQIALQRSDFVAIQRVIQDTGREEVICNIAGWFYELSSTSARVANRVASLSEEIAVLPDATARLQHLPLGPHEQGERLLESLTRRGCFSREQWSRL